MTDHRRTDYTSGSRGILPRAVVGTHSSKSRFGLLFPSRAPSFGGGFVCGCGLPYGCKRLTWFEMIGLMINVEGAGDLMMKDGFANDFLMDCASHHWGGNDDYDYIHQRLMWRPERWFSLEIMHQTKTDASSKMSSIPHVELPMSASAPSDQVAPEALGAWQVALKPQERRAWQYFTLCRALVSVYTADVDVDEEGRLGRWAVTNLNIYIYVILVLIWRFRWITTWGILVYHPVADL